MVSQNSTVIQPLNKHFIVINFTTIVLAITTDKQCPFLSAAGRIVSCPEDITNSEFSLFIHHESIISLVQDLWTVSHTSQMFSNWNTCDVVSVDSCFFLLEKPTNIKNGDVNFLHGYLATSVRNNNRKTVSSGDVAPRRTKEWRSVRWNVWLQCLTCVDFFEILASLKL